MTPFALNLRKRAKELGISNAEVARRSDLGERRYANYIIGKREPDLATLVRIARVLGTTPNELLGIDGYDDKMNSSALTRLMAAIHILEPEVLEILAIQAEALAARSFQKPDKADSSQLNT